MRLRPLLIAVVAVLVLAAGAAWFVWLRQPPAVVLPESASPRDAHTIKQLAAAGSDLARPHRIDFFFRFPNKAGAALFASDYEPRGFVASVKPAKEGDGWAVVLSQTMVPDERALGTLRDEFNARLKAAGGHYEGWGAPVVR